MIVCTARLTSNDKVSVTLKSNGFCKVTVYMPTGKKRYAMTFETQEMAVHYYDILMTQMSSKW